MKKCPMCGSAAIDDAAICFECLYSFARMSCAAMNLPVAGDASGGAQGADEAIQACVSPSQADMNPLALYDVAVDDPDFGYSTYSLRSGSLHIGRLASNDIVLADPMVSRRHMRMFVEMGQVWAEVLRAKNAPRINGEPFWGKVRVAPEDVIRVRQATLRVVGRGGADDTISPRAGAS